MSEYNPIQAHAEHFRRKRRMKRLVILALALTIGFVGWALITDLQRRPTAPVHTPLPQSVSQQALNYTYTRSRQGRPIFTIHAKQTRALEGSKTILQGVRVTIYDRNDAGHDEVETGQCAYNTASGALACFGPASIIIQGRQAKEASDSRLPVILKTSDISYDPRDSVVRTSRAVQGNYGSLSGSAVGLAYNTQQGWLVLQKDASFTLTSNSGKPPMHVTAGRARYDKKAEQMVLGAPVTAWQADRRLSAMNGIILFDASNRVTQITLSGSVEAAALLAKGTFRGNAGRAVATLDPATSQLRELRARDAVSLEFQQTENGVFRRLRAQHVLLRFGKVKNEATDGEADGDVQLVFEAGRPRTSKAEVRVTPLGGTDKPRTSKAEVRATPLGRSGRSELSTARLAFTFRPGNLLREAHTIGPGTLTSTRANAGSERDTLAAGHFTMSFDGLGRLDELDGLAGTRISVQPGANSRGAQSPVESTAQRADVLVDAASGNVKTIRQYGNLQLRQLDRRGSGREGIYQAESQEMRLVGHPVIWDSENRIHAHDMILFLDTGIAKGSGGVESSHFFPASGGRPADSDRAQDDVDAPLVILADRVTVNRNMQMAQYEGRVRAWRGPDVIESSSLTLDRKKQQVSSPNEVVTTLLQASQLSDSVDPASGTKSKTKPRPSEPVTIRAAHLLYFNIGQKAIYQGNVEVQSGDMLLRSRRLEVYFGKGGAASEASVTKAIATDHVVVNQPPGRRATGERAVYFVPLGKIVLTGGPPKLYEEAQSGFLTAQSLTFYVRNDSLVADGSARTPTLSRNRVQQR